MTVNSMKLYGITLILLVLLISGCQLAPTSLPIITPEQSEPISLLVSIDVPAQIKREGWKDYQPVGFGTLVNPTDLLATDGMITILCSDMQTIKSVTGLNRNPCPLPGKERALIYDDMWISSSVRSAPSPTVPYILYPRNTTILEPHPILSWHDTGANSYRVEIRQGVNTIWQQASVMGNTIAYPTDAPKLIAGKDYLLVVTDNTTGLSSTTDPNKGLGFQVADSDQIAALEQNQQIIFNMTELDPAAKKLALALLYNQTKINGRGFWGEARELLTDVAHSQPSAPAVNMRLGEVLGKMKLWADAQAAYESALTQAQSLNDLESQAEALAALWRITHNQEQFDKSVNLYEELGDKDKVTELMEEFVP